MQAIAETKLGGRDFNHNTTGFTLSGGHATTACETCHVGGVFKGTPKNCDGCHSLGKRVVATPKSTGHVVTDAPCESCHFNTSTWLGARYNHGAAVPGQCTTCHNGRAAKGKHAAHVATTYSCDQCHRSSSWVPASWNHTGATYSGQDCGTCHKTGGPGRNYTTTAKHTTFISSLAISNCKSCHTNYYSFYSHYYIHDKPFFSCAECHANPSYTTAGGVTQAVKPIHTFATIAGITNCESCHARSYASFVGARYLHNDAAFGANDCLTCHNSANQTAYGIKAMPPNHIPLDATARCNVCHVSGSSWGGMQHSQVATLPCTTCHLKGGPVYLGNMDKKGVGHEGWNGTGDCSQAGCHRPAGSRGIAFVDWD
jgi:hypothetical protein